MNLFRTPKWDSEAREWTRPLDLKYLRICSVYRLLKHRKIDKARAMELLSQRHNSKEMKSLAGTVECWLTNSDRGWDFSHLDELSAEETKSFVGAMEPAHANGGCACTSIDRSHCNEPDCPVAT